MDQDKMDRELRRDRDTLAIVGLGVMAFGVWSVIRAAMQFFLQLPALREEFADEAYSTLAIVIVGILLLALLALDLRLRLYVGRSARAEGLRGVSGRGYLYAAGFLAAMSLVSIVFSALSLADIDLLHAETKSTTGADEYVTSIVIELTSLVTLIEMIAASIRVKRAARRQEEEAR